MSHEKNCLHMKCSFESSIKWRIVNGLHLYSDFLTSGHSKRFTTFPNIHPFTQRRWCRLRMATASSSVALRVRCHALGQLHTLLGGAGDRTSNLPVTSQPALPSEPHATRLSKLRAVRAWFLNWGAGKVMYFLGGYLKLAWFSNISGAKLGYLKQM